MTAFVTLVGGCDEAPSAPAGLGTEAPRFDIVGGNGQQGPAGSELPRPLVVRVTVGGEPVEGQIVNYVVTAGGGSVFAGASITNADGLAQDYWTLGTTIGSPQEVQVRAVNSTTGSAVVYGSFTATALGPVATVAVTPASVTVEVGRTIQLGSTLRDAMGAVLPVAGVAWTSSDTGVATVDSNGLVRALGVGNTVIRASSDGHFDEAQVSVVRSAA